MSVEINDTNFPNSVLRTFISNNYDLNNDGVLSDAEISAVTSIVLNGISDIGIFRSYEGLDVFTEVQTISIENCSGLTGISCASFLKLESLTITGCSDLTGIYTEPYRQTSLTSIQISNCPNLTILRAYGHNPASPPTVKEDRTRAALSAISIDQTSRSKIEEYTAPCTSLTSIDTSGMGALKILDLRCSSISSIDLSSCSSLETFSCWNNNLTSVIFGNIGNLKDVALRNNSLTQLDLPYSPYLEVLYISLNSLVKFDLANTPLILEDCPNKPGDNGVIFDYRSTTPVKELQSANMGQNYIAFDSSTLIYVSKYGIEINATNFPDSVFRQFVSDTFDLDKDGYLNDSEIASATRINIGSYGSMYAQLQSFEGIEHLQYLTYFFACCGAQAIDFSSNSKLEYVYINDHRLTSVEFGEQKKLIHVGIQKAPITSIDLSDCMFVEELNTQDCYALNELIIGNPNAIKKLNLFKLNLVNFDAGLYPNMTDLVIYGCANESAVTGRYGPTGETIFDFCGMESLTAINHTALTTIHVNNFVNLQSLSEVDLTGSINLTRVWITLCKNLNSIVGLKDLSSLSSLNMAWCPIPKLDISNSVILVDVFRNGKVANDGNVKYHYYERGNYEKYLSYSSYYGTKIDDGSIKKINQPSDLVLAESETGEFICTVDNELAIYCWEKWDDEAEDWTILDDGRTSRLEIIADSSIDGTKYRCLVSTPTDSKYSNVVTLTIARAPVILNHPQSETVIEGDIVAFSVTSSGHNLSYQWQFSSDNGETWNDIRNTNSASLSVIATVSLDDYRYHCIATNDLGTATSDPATLTVIPDTSISPPVIATQPSSITVAEGSSVTFAVEVSGSDISYQWQVFKNNQWTNIQNAASASYATVGTRSADGNRYRCVISNAAGAIYSAPATLTVTMGVYVSTPRILAQPRSVNVELGELVTFWIRADGGDLSYQWQKLNNGTWYDITGATSASYVVMARTEVHNTQYRCVITNTAGSVTSNTATLSIRAGHDLSFYGYHSIIISGKNTYGEWEMYPTSRPHVAPPEVKTSYVDLPGADGGLDYTDLLTGEPRYGYRKGSWEFLLIPQDRWAAVYRSLVNFLHGRQHTVILEDDPNYVYTGRLSVNEWQSAAHNSLITIDYILEPFPRNISGQEEDEEENQILSMASTLLNKEKYAGMVIGKFNGAATLIYPDMLFDNGDNIAY